MPTPSRFRPCIPTFVFARAVPCDAGNLLLRPATEVDASHKIHQRRRRNLAAILPSFADDKGLLRIEVVLSPQTEPFSVDLLSLYVDYPGRTDNIGKTLLMTALNPEYFLLVHS